MGVIDLRRRLERIEATRSTGAANRIFSDRSLTEGEAAEALASWRELVAKEKATVSGNVLRIVSPKPLTAKKWAAKYAQETEQLH